MADSLRSDFMLEPGFIYLNHGSYGACPRPVYAAYQAWQARLESHPQLFMRNLADYLAESRARLGEYLGAPADDIVYFQNPTTALNAAIRSMRLKPGDEVLTTDHEYGAIDRTWRFVCQKTGATIVRQAIALPVKTRDAVVNAVWSGVTERTRVISISHYTSPTALILPVEEICRRAREAGIVTIVDGAHAPGQMPLNLSTLGADFYAGSCHKWLCAPKGTGFLYARREMHALLDPLVVSYGWESERPGPSLLVDYQQYQGTRDNAGYLAVPAAIDYQRQHNWDTVVRRCFSLARVTRRRIHELTGLEPLSPDSPHWYSQMTAVRLPVEDAAAFGQRLYDEFHIEAPVLRWNNQTLLRLSFQAYVSEDDAGALLAALQRMLRA